MRTKLIRCKKDDFKEGKNRSTRGKNLEAQKRSNAGSNVKLIEIIRYRRTPVKLFTELNDIFLSEQISLVPAILINKILMLRIF